MLENTRNHINYYTLGIGGQDYLGINLSELEIVKFKQLARWRGSAVELFEFDNFKGAPPGEPKGSLGSPGRN